MMAVAMALAIGKSKIVAPNATASTREGVREAAPLGRPGRDKTRE
jgi:hypothetical protein